MRPLMKRIIDIGLSLYCYINYSNVHCSQSLHIFSLKSLQIKKIDTIYMEALNAMLLSNKRKAINLLSTSSEK